MSSVSLSDDHQPRCASVFLDTSIHCSMHKGDAIFTKIKWLRELFQWRTTSSYTLMEFGNVVLAPATYFRRELETKSLSQLLSHLGNALYDQHHAAKRTWGFNLLTRNFGTDEKRRTRKAQLFLETLILTGITAIRSFLDSPIEDGTRCFFPENGVKKSQSPPRWESPNCKRKNPRCEIAKFFTLHVDEFSRIKRAIDELPEEAKTTQLKDFSRVIEQATADPEILLEYHTGCKLLADAVIAVESRGCCSMFSQNSAESVVLTKVFGQDFYCLSNNQSAPVVLEMFSAPDVVYSTKEN